MSDPFAKLPIELLDEIAAFVHEEHPQQYVGAISKAFLPSARRRFFTHVTINRVNSLSRFTRAVEASIAASRTVKSLVLTGSLDDNTCNFGRRGWMEVQSLFKRSTELDELIVDEPDVPCDYIADTLLHPPTNGNQLPHLHVLKLKYRSLSEENQFDAARYVYLDRYPRLDALELDIGYDRTSLGWKQAPKPKGKKLKGRKSWWISLTGELSINRTIPDFLTLFPSIDTLTLAEKTRDAAPSFSQHLNALRKPEDLTALILRHKHERPIEDVLSSLSSFRKLASLDLGPGTFEPSSFPNLALLPQLTRVALSCAPDLSYAELTPLLDLPFLKTLRLDGVRRFAWQDCYPVDPHDYKGWTSSFTFETAGELLDLAESKGVNLVGLAVGLVKREREYEKRWGKKQG